jgi:hypothetical protein
MASLDQQEPLIATNINYRVFPPDVVSNTFDFEARWVIHHGRRMRGVFARRRIDLAESVVFIGIYPGRRKSQTEIEQKAARYSVRHAVDERMAARKTNAYLLSLERVEPGYDLDPTDEDGELLPEFASGIVCYINENPPGSVPKASFVYNLPRSRYEVWLQQGVEQDEEIFLYYGNRYFRDYPVDAEAGESRYYYLIPEGSAFTPDPRGIPPPMEIPPAAEVQALSANRGGAEESADFRASASHSAASL